MENDLEKWMVELGLEELKNDEKLKGLVNSEPYYIVEDDHSAIEAICGVLAAMQFTSKYGYSTGYDVLIQQSMKQLRKYLYKTNE